MIAQFQGAPISSDPLPEPASPFSASCGLNPKRPSDVAIGALREPVFGDRIASYIKERRRQQNSSMRFVLI
jgi:hypothetical protein